MTAYGAHSSEWVQEDQAAEANLSDQQKNTFELAGVSTMWCTEASGGPKGTDVPCLHTVPNQINMDNIRENKH